MAESEKIEKAVRSAAEAAVESDASPGGIARQRDALVYLHDRIDLLALRLDEVMCADYPHETVDTSDMPSVFDSQVTEVLRAASRIDHLISRLVL